MNNCGKLREGSNEGFHYMFPQFQSIKLTSVAFTINKMLQGCVGMVGGFKRSDSVETPIYRDYVDDMVINTTLDVLSAITRGAYYYT